MTNSREKGKRGERELAAKLREHGYDCRRGVQYQGGPDSPDVIGLPHAPKEIRHLQRWCNNKWIFRSCDWEDYLRGDTYGNSKKRHDQP